jgi:hypothetical protein
MTKPHTLLELLLMDIITPRVALYIYEGLEIPYRIELEE